MSFWNDFSAGFVPAYRQSLQNAYENAYRERELKMREAEHAARMEQLQAAKEREKQLDEAYKNLATTTTVGVLNQDVNARQQADFDAAVAATAAGQEAPPVDTALWSAPLYRPATRPEVAQAMLQVGAAARSPELIKHALDEKKKQEVMDFYKSITTDQRDEYEKRAMQYINNAGDIKLTIADDIDSKGRKTGFKLLTMVEPDGSPNLLRLSRAEMDMFLLGVAYIEKDDPATGLALINSVNKDLAARAKDYVTMQSAVVSTNNQARNLADDNELNRQRLALDQSRLGLAWQQASQQNAALQRLRAEEALAQDAMGVAMGFERARQLGPQGEEAAKIYQEQLAGINAQLRALGRQPITLGQPKQELSPKDEATLLTNYSTYFTNAGYTPQEAAAFARAKVDIARQAITPEGTALSVASLPAEAHARELSRWKAVDPQFGMLVEAHLAQILARQQAAQKSTSQADRKSPLPAPLTGTRLPDARDAKDQPKLGPLRVPAGKVEKELYDALLKSSTPPPPAAPAQRYAPGLQVPPNSVMRLRNEATSNF